MHVFDSDSQVVPAGAGEYSATMSARFSLASGSVNGGYGLAVCTQALKAELAFPDPLVVSATYLRPVLTGPVTIQVEQLRTGRRHASGSARLLQDGVEAVRVVATFADLATAPGRNHVVPRPPDLPPPEVCLDPVAGRVFGDDSIVARTEVRFASPPGWITGTPSGDPSAEFWMRFADGRDADTISLPSLVDMAFPVVFELGEFSTTTIELTVHVRARPVPGWLACRVRTSFVMGGYHEEDFEIWDSAGTLVAQSRQLQLLTAARPG
jgi:acyl-CoA thioesterase